MGRPKKHPIVFVHGILHGAWCWDEHFLAYFAERGYETHAISLRGHGRSRPRGPIRWNSVADYVDDVMHLIDALENPPILVGHSMGGLVVQRLLETYDAPAAILLASVPAGSRIRLLQQFFSIHPYFFFQVLFSLNMKSIVPALKASFLSDNLPEDERTKIQEMLSDDVSFLATWEMLWPGPRPERISSPIVVMGAENDRIISPALVRATADAYHTEARIFQDTAHDMMLDPHWPLVADAMLEQLETLRC